MVHGFVRSLVAFSVTLLSIGSLTAQTAQELFKQGVRLLHQNKDTEALAVFRKVIEADPGNAEAYALWKDTELRIWGYMITQGGDLEKIARRLLALAKVKRQERKADAALIAPLVAKALSDDTGDRREADLTLASNHGEYAVPYFVQALGDADDVDQQIRAIMAMERIGALATLPLLPLLGSENKILRQNAASALLHIGDIRALPALQRLAEKDKDAGVRDVAKRAVAKIGGQGVPTAVDLYVQHSKSYLRGDLRLVRDTDASIVMWDLVDGKLVSRKVPAQLFVLEEAKAAAYGALAVDPESRQGLVALTRAYIAERSVIASVLAGDPGNSEMSAVEGSIAELDITVLAAGADIVRVAVNENIAENMIASAVQGLQILARVEDPGSLAGSPLLAGLTNTDKRIAYASALGLASMNAAIDATARAQVVDVLAKAVLEQSIKKIAVFTPNQADVIAIREGTSSKDGFWVDAPNKTSKGIADILETQPDVVVINESIESRLPRDVIDIVRKRLPKTKIILVARDLEQAKKMYDGKVDGFIAGPVEASAIKKKVDEVLMGVDLGENRRVATRISVSAAEALASLDTEAYGVSNASSSLATAAGREGQIALFSLKALARAGNSGALDAVLAVLGRNKANADVAIGACEALGRIMARSGGEANATIVTALTALASDKAAVDRKVRSAAVAALGRAPLSGTQRSALFNALRVNPDMGGDGP